MLIERIFFGCRTTFFSVGELNGSMGFWADALSSYLSTNYANFTNFMASALFIKQQ